MFETSLSVYSRKPDVFSRCGRRECCIVDLYSTLLNINSVYSECIGHWLTLFLIRGWVSIKVKETLYKPESSDVQRDFWAYFSLRVVRIRRSLTTGCGLLPFSLSVAQKFSM